MAKSMKVYEVVHDVPGHSFDPIGFQMSSLADAKKKLRSMRVLHPDAYIATVTYSRLTENRAKKGAR